MRDIAPQMLHEIVQDRSSGPNRGGFVFEPKAVQRGDFEMIADGELRGFRREDPIVVGVEDGK